MFKGKDTKTDILKYQIIERKQAKISEGNKEHTSTKIHIDLSKIDIPKIDIDRYLYGLLCYCNNKNFDRPYLFTANVPPNTDIGYLTVLKNNAVIITDEIERHADIILSDDCKFPERTKNKVLEMKMLTHLEHTDNPKQICIYMDWDNIQVSSDNIKLLVVGIKQFIESVKVYNVYTYYVFLHTKIPDKIKVELKKQKVIIINIIKDKQKNGDEEMIRFIQKNTVSTDALCVVSGDRDFSCLMVEYVRNNHEVFLVYNKQALYTFKMNKHWVSSIDIACLPKYGLEIGSKDISIFVKTTNRKTQKKKSYMEKPCKFYNLYTCDTLECPFLHLCGICGDNHKSKDFHPLEYNLKSQICRNYNSCSAICINSSMECNFLHICLKCKHNHKLSECDFIVMICPICDDKPIKNKIDFVYHLLHPDHLQKTKTIQNIITAPVQKHVLITR